MSVESGEDRPRGFIDEAIDFALDRRTLIGGLLMIIVFTLSFVAIVTILNAPAVANSPQMKGLLNRLENEKSGLENLSMNPVFLFAYIFVRNSLVSILIYIFSVTILIPLIIMSFNGMLVGLIVHLLLSQTQIHVALASIQATPSHASLVLLSYVALAPHGMLEIPSISLVAATTAWLLKPIPNKNPFSSALKAGSRLLTLTILNLLVSAFVEAFITLTLAASLLILLLAAPHP